MGISLYINICEVVLVDEDDNARNKDNVTINLSLNIS